MRVLYVLLAIIAILCFLLLGLVWFAYLCITAPFIEEPGERMTEEPKQHPSVRTAMGRRQ